MGFISDFDLDGIIRKYGIHHFFETGTWKGDAVQHALQFSFRRIFSVEIVSEIAMNAQKKFEEETRVTILEGNSTIALANELPRLQGSCLFWLDAHFPGADAGLEEYDAIPDEEIRLPLENELQIIHQYRQGSCDIIIIDDLRIYEDGPYENGAAPADTLPKQNRNLDFVNRLFSNSHQFIKSYQKEGYLLLLPKQAGADATANGAGLFNR